jgi:GAF domain-containing protein
MRKTKMDKKIIPAHHAVLVSDVSAVVETERSDLEVLQEVVNMLKQTMPNWNWVGIYLFVNDHLVLGPYVGKPTDHTRIEVGVGVCGTAVKDNANIIVDDVRKRDNYLACTLETRSELVVLIRHHGNIVGQFDIDSDKEANFCPDDEHLLESIAPLIGEHCYRLGKSM